VIDGDSIRDKAESVLWSSSEELHAQWLFSPGERTRSALDRALCHIIDLIPCEGVGLRLLEASSLRWKDCFKSIFEWRKQVEYIGHASRIDPEVLKDLDKLVPSPQHLFIEEKIKHIFSVSLEDCVKHLNSEDAILSTIARKRVSIGK
jgi:hypothetical protein